MSGYHSRSPEEFKKYLESIQSNQKKKNWKQWILFIDVILLILVFYMTFRFLQPGAGEANMSPKGIIDGNQAYLALSREPDTNFQGYFFFVENLKEKEWELPAKDWKKVEFRLVSQSSKICYTEEIQWKPKLVSSRTKDFYYYSFDKRNLESLSEECKKEIMDKNPSFFRSRFLALTLGFYAEIRIERENDRLSFVLLQKPYR